jgi:hypothetical protein
MKQFLLIFLMASGFACFSQNTVDDLKKINLPPGTILSPKFEFIDYSYKLNYISSNTSGNGGNKNFLQEFSEVDLTEIKDNTPEKYQYYLKAQDFYNDLANNVKSLYTIEELWYIYMYDVELTNKLRAIK